MTILRTRLRRRACRRWDHQWGDWKPTWQIFVQASVCEHCGDARTRTLFDQIAETMRENLGNLGRSLTR